jgi:hypothetical protein
MPQRSVERARWKQKGILIIKKLRWYLVGESQLVGLVAKAIPPVANSVRCV